MTSTSSVPTAEPAAVPSPASTSSVPTAEPAAAPAKQAAGPSSWRAGKRRTSGGSGSGLLLGLVLYPVALAFLRDGIPGMKAWIAAKFLNRTTATPAKAKTTAASSGGVVV